MSEVHTDFGKEAFHGWGCDFWESGQETVYEPVLSLTTGEKSAVCVTDIK